MKMRFTEFYEEQLEVRGLKKSQVPEFIKMETGYEVSQSQVYEFLSPDRGSCPNACIAAIFEAAFKVNLPPKYYGADNAYPKADKK
jgi:hypothetical protein